MATETISIMKIIVGLHVQAITVSISVCHQISKIGNFVPDNSYGEDYHYNILLLISKY